MILKKILSDFISLLIGQPNKDLTHPWKTISVIFILVIFVTSILIYTNI